MLLCCYKTILYKFLHFALQAAQVKSRRILMPRLQIQGQISETQIEKY